MDNMLNPGRDSQIHENANTEQPFTTEYQLDIPQITIDDPDQNRTIHYGSASSTETEMSSSHRRSSSSTTRGKHSSSSKKPKKDDWSEITDPEERRRVQNRIAQRKFRDKAKETKERQERDAENRAHAHYSYHTPDPGEMGSDEQLSGLPWGSLSLRHVVSRGHAKESESRRSSKMRDDRSSSSNQFEAREHVYDDGDGYYEDASPAYYDDGDQAYYDYAASNSGSGSGSGSGHGGTSH